MKISLLLEREPFAAIVQRTLTNYLSAVRGEPISVLWRNMPWHRRWSAPATGEWLCQPQLNVIFSPRVDPAALSPIRREFSYSVTPLRRPIQALYVRAALSPPMARWFSGVRLAFEPSWPDEANEVIIPGNQKLRILNHRQRTATSIVKDGFPLSALQREIEGRQKATEAGLPIPRILAADTAAGWMCEEYLCATPLNRIASSTEHRAAHASAIAHLWPLLHSTTELISIHTYVIRLQTAIRDGLATLRAQDAQLGNDLRTRTDRLVALLIEQTSADQLLPLAFTHGDFQPANILVNQTGIWIIDWEHAGIRQRNYDAWVLLAAARRPQGLAERVNAICQTDLSAHTSFLEPGFESGCKPKAKFFLSAMIFFLEELVWRLSEENHLIFYGAAPGLYALGHELGIWEGLCPRNR